MKKEKGKKKKRFLRKRNVIFAIILLIVVSLTANFFVSCGKDEFETTPDVETITNQASTMLKPPTDGSVPTDYDAKTNVYYAIYAMNSLNSFTTESYGETVTKVALVSVSQKIKSSRVVNNGEVYKENVSHSSFKSVGSRTYVKGENYVVHNANNVSSIDEVTWEETANRISKDSYFESFGYVPNSITGYLLTDETILSAEFLGEENGIYSFHYDLDTEKSTGRLSLEMRTMAGSTSMPLFDKASITVRMNKDWQVTEVVTSSIYSVNLLGGVTCTESVTEKFSNYNQGVQVPNVEFYNSYLDAEITEPAPETLTATDYLMAGFADYVNGSKPLKINGAISSSTLSANLDALVSISLEDLASTSLSLNLKELKYQDVSVKDVFVAFENPNLYIKAGEFKAVTTIEELSGAFSNLSSTFGIDLASKIPSIDLSGLDLTSLISGATLTETDALATISLPLTFGDLSINANIVLSKGENVSVKEITASIGELNVKLTINDEIVLPEKGEGYNAITPLLSALNENVKAQIELGDASALVNLNLKTFELDAFINELSLGDFDLKDVKVKLLDNVIYANVNGVKAKLNLSSVNSILDKLFFLPINIELPDLGSITNIDASTIIVGALNTLSTTSEQDGLSITANVLGCDVRLLLSVTNGEYSLGGISIDFSGTNVNANLYNGDVPSIAKEDLANYNDIATLLDIIENNEINLSVKAFDLDIDLSVNLTDFTILAKTQLFGETLYAKLSNDKVYISYKGLNAYVDLADIDNVLDKLGAFVGDIELPDFSNITIESIISSLTIAETDVITIATNINGIDVNVILDKTNGLRVASVNLAVEDIEISATPSVKADYSALNDKTFYNAITLLDIIENNEVNLSVNALGYAIDLNVNLIDFTILAKTTLYGETLYAKLSNNKVYLSYKGLNAYVDLADIDNVLDKLGVFVGDIELPDFSGITIESVISSLTITETDVITIATEINGIDIAIVLDKTNGLKVNSVSAKVEDIEITATPSVKADYSGMNATNYYNLVTLLDVIENNEINLSVKAFDLDIDLSVNLTDFTILTKTQLFGETLYAKLSNNKICVSYKGLNAYVDLADIDNVLDKLGVFVGNIELPDFSGITIESIISSLTITETDVITLALDINGIDIAIVLDKTNGLKVACVNLAVEDIEISATPSVKADYSALNDKTFYNAITLLDIIENNEVNLSVNAFDLDIDLSVNLTDFTILAKTQLYGETLYAKLSNNKVYVSYKGLNAYVDLADVSSVLDKLGVFVGDIELPDFAGITIESIISSLIITETDVITIATNINGIDVNVILDKTNGLKVNSVSAKVEDIEITATPSVKADYSGMSNGNYYNAITLLDIIENNEINLSVKAFDLDIDLSVNLTDFTILAKTTLYGETLYAKLSNNKVYISYKGLNAYVDLADIDKVLDKLGVFVGEIELPDFSGITIESIISSLTITETDVITIATNINGIDIAIVLDKTNGLKVNSVSAKVEDIEITATPSVKADYSGMNATNYYNAITLLDIIENNEVNLGVNALGYAIDLNINLTDFTILAKTTLYGETLYAKLSNSKVYISYKGLNAYVDLADVSSVLDKLGVFVGDIELPDFSNITIESIISSLTITETDVITLALDINDIDLSVILDKTNGLKVNSVSAKVEDIEISATPSVKADYSGMNATNYYNLVTLLDIIDNNEVNLSVKALSYAIDLNVNLTDFTILAKTQLFGETLYAKLSNDKVYISYKGLNAYVDLADVSSVLDRLGIFVGEIELPDFSGITIESIISSLTITETDVITIATEINGTDIAIILDKTNGLKVNSVSAKVEDIEISATPSVKADYSGMSNGNYYNLVTLLDVIDENGKINVTANAFNLDVYATIDLVNGEIFVKVDDFEILVSIEENVIYARYPGAIAKLDISDINFILNELKPLITRFITEEEFNSIDVDALKNISIEDIISSISVTEYESIINVKIALSCAVADITLDKGQNGLIVSGGTIKMDVIEIPFTLTNEVLSLTFDKTLEYIDLTSVVETLAPALRNILTLDNLYANMTATLTTGNKIYDLTKCEVLITNIYSAPRARVSLALTISTVNPDGTITEDSRHEIELYYLDPSLVAEGAINTYFTYNDMTNAEDVFAGSFTTVNFYETLDIIKQIYGNMPELRDALKPFIVPDEKGMPKFMELNVKFNELINSALFANGTFMLDLNGKAVMPDLGSSVLVNLFSQNGLLCLDLEEFKLRDTFISLNACVGEAPSGVITEDKFTFTPADNTQNFSSINELLKALEKTSQKRYFEIDAKVSITGSGDLSILEFSDKVKIKLYLCVVDGKTYFKADLVREHVVAIWKDYEGSSTIWFDTDAQMIYIHNVYYNKVFGFKGSKKQEYLKYTVEEFSADALNIILNKILRLSDSIFDLINNKTSEQTTNTATIENTLKAYSYNGTDTFNITLDLAPLTTDIKTANVTIKHDSAFNLTDLNASVNMINLIDLKLNATLTTKVTSEEEDTAISNTINEILAQASNSNYN